MGFFLKKSNIRSKGLYLQIYQSFYIPGKGGRNKSYQVIGYASDLVANGISDPVAYAQSLVDDLNKNSNKKIDLQIGSSSTKKFAGHFLVKAIFDYLNFDEHINIVASSFKCHYNFADFLKTLTYAQIVSPGSKLYAFEKVIPNLYNSVNYSYDQILDGIEFLGSDYHKYIEVLNHFIDIKWPRNLNTAFFDCTNYYFEIDEEDDFRKKGPSKENRHDPIIGQSLLLDADMIPLDMQLYPGNQSERPLLRSRIEDIKSKNNISGRVIQIADKGLNCARNIYAASIEANDGYIFSKSVHGKYLSNLEKDWILLDDNLDNKWFDVRNSKGQLLYRFKECVDNFSYKCKLSPDDIRETTFTVKEKRIVTYNPSLAAKQKREILKQVDRLSQKISYKDVIRDDLGDASKYVYFEATTIDGENVKIASHLNQDKINEDLMFAGYNLLVTSEFNAPAKDIYNAYHNLWRIEHSFRLMKTYLNARPVFLTSKYSIFGHFLIVYFSLVVMRLLELKVFNDEIPVEQLFDFIRDYQLTENFDGSFINNASLSSTYFKIKDKLSLSKLGNVYLSKRDVDLLFNIDL